MYAVTFPDDTSREYPDAKGYRIQRNGTLVIWGHHYQTIAAYPAGTWAYVSQAAPTKAGDMAAEIIDGYLKDELVLHPVTQITAAYLNHKITVKTRNGNDFTGWLDGYTFHHYTTADPDNPDHITIMFDMQEFGTISIPPDAQVRIA